LEPSFPLILFFKLLSRGRRLELLRNKEGCTALTTWELRIESIDKHLRNRSCTKYPISYFVTTKHLSMQHQGFLSAIDAIRVPTSVQEALKDEDWVQAKK